MEFKVSPPTLHHILSLSFFTSFLEKKKKKQLLSYLSFQFVCKQTKKTCILFCFLFRTQVVYELHHTLIVSLYYVSCLSIWLHNDSCMIFNCMYHNLVILPIKGHLICYQTSSIAYNATVTNTCTFILNVYRYI